MWRRPWTFVLSLLAAASLPGTLPAQTTAVCANDFLNSLGVCAHVTQGVDASDAVAGALEYEGIRNMRDEGSSDPVVQQELLSLHANAGVKLCLLPVNGNVASSLAIYDKMAAAGALLAVEGPNEINNFSVTYQGLTSSYTGSYLPAARFQRDLYMAVKADAALAGIPVFAPSEAGGSEPDNVGFQFVTIPAGSNLGMPDGTIYGDFANTHNYVCAQLSAPIDNCAWGAEGPTVNTQWDGMVGEYSSTWRNHFTGYSLAQLSAVPRVTTETGWPTQGTHAISQDTQGKLFLNMYLDAYLEGWSYTFIYMLRDDPVQGYWGLVDTSYTPKKSGVYIHNLTTILADETSFAPDALAYSIPGEPATMHDLLLEKSGGVFELAVWNERASGSDTVSVNLGAMYPTVAIYDPTVGTAPVQVLTNVSAVPLSLGDHPLIVEVGGTGTPVTTPPVQVPLLSDVDIGNPGVAGSAALHGAIYTVRGGGTDIWNAADQFNYAYASVSGDGTMIAHVDTVANTDVWAKAGLVFRNSLAAGAANVGIYQNPSGVVELQWRDADNGPANTTAQTGPAGAKWLKLVKAGSVYSGYYATTTGTPGATDWILIALHATPFSNPSFYGGIGVTAHNNGLLNVSVFSGLSISGAGTGTGTGTPTGTSTSTGTGTGSGSSTGTGTGTGSGSGTSTGTGSGTSTGTGGAMISLTDADIGSPGKAGSGLTGTTYIVAGGGSDVFNYADQFNFYSTSLVGNTTLIAHVDSMTATDTWAKSGLMLRNSLSAGAANVAVFENPSGVVELQWRDADGGASNTTLQTGVSGAKWLRLAKAGTVFSASYATTGGAPGAADWILIGTHTTTFTSTAYLGGLAVTAHNNGLLNMSVFSGLTINGAGAGTGTGSGSGTTTGTGTGTSTGTGAGTSTGTGATSLSDADIGAPYLAGSAANGSTTNTVTGGGSDIFYMADQLNYDSEALSGNVTLIVHVDSMAGTDAWAKAGLMMRNSLAAGAANVSVFQNPSGVVELQWRDVDNAGSNTTAQAGPAGAKWLELRKTGSNFTAYYATTSAPPGVADWVLIGTHTTTLNAAFRGGLAVTAHNNGLLNTAAFSGFSQQ